MLEDERGRLVDDTVEWGDLGEDDVAQMIGVADRDLEEEIVAAADEEDPDRLGEGPETNACSRRPSARRFTSA